MRATLRNLKMLDAEELGDLWEAAEFPFDYAKCGQCLTMHSPHDFLRCRKHAQLTQALQGKSFVGAWHRFLSLFKRARDVEDETLVTYLEELYALRLFYDSLYPPSEEAPSPTVALAESCSKSEVGA